MDSKKKDCFKCKQKSTFVYKNGLFVCRECFVGHVMLRRLRSFLRNELQNFGKDNKYYVLADGSIGSLCLLKMLQLSIAEDAVFKRKMFLQFEAVHIDADRLCEKLALPPSNSTERVKEFCQSLGVAVNVYPVLEDSEFEEWTELGLKTSVKGGFRQEFLQALIRRKRALVCAGKKLLLPDFAETCSIKALYLLSTCRQGDLLRECSPSFLTLEGGVEARPLIEFQERELLYFAYGFQLFKFLAPTIVREEGEDETIFTLMSSFVTDLQGENFSTSSAILKTMERLAPPELPKTENFVEDFRGNSKKVKQALETKELEPSEEGTFKVCPMCAMIFEPRDSALCKGCQIMFGLRLKA